MITRDMETVVIIGRLALIVAFITTTSFPFLYWFSPWYRSRLGQAVMLQSATLALVVWLKTALTFFLINGPRTLFLWVNVVVLVMIAIASTTLTYLQWKLLRKNKSKETINESIDPASSAVDQPSAK